MLLSDRHAWEYAECFIAAMNDTGISIMNAKGAYKTDIPNVPESLIGVGHKLLNSNKNYRRGAWNLFSKLDFDIVHQCIEGKPVETVVKPYFAFEDFKRSREESMVVVHAIVAEF